MKILTILGTTHKGNTKAIVDLFLNEFKDDNNEFDEIILPKDMPEFCYGCANCILKGEDKCPHYNLINPIVKRIEQADLIIIATPVYVMSCSSSLKALLDHLAYLWLVHRPNENMFNKVGLNKEVLDFEDKDDYLKRLNVKDITKLKEYNSLEIGNNFELGTRYSDSMGLYYKDENGEDKPYYMGCYGIGIGRIIAVMLENNVLKDEKGNIKGFSLPEIIAPYKVQIIYKEDKKQLADALYNKLEQLNIKCIIDDRDNYSLGNRIKDAYILGTPYIVILGDKTENFVYEIEKTKTFEKFNLSEEELINLLKK